MKLLSLFILGLTGLSAHASECSNIQYLDTKSQGVEVINDQCDKANEVGLGTVFKLRGGARLWIKSIPKPTTDSNFQIVCQSASDAPIEVTVSSLFLPWITPNDLKNCSGWVDNKLKCDGINGDSNVFYCAIAAIKQAESAGVQDLAMTTSVKMRRLSAYEEQQQIDQLVAAMEPEIELCRRVFQVNNKLTVNWTVDSAGKAKDISLSPMNSSDKRLSDCVETVVENFSYPQLKAGQKISHAF